MRGKRAILGIALAAVAAAGVGAPPAQAEEETFSASPTCQAAYVDGRYVGHYCVIIDFGLGRLATVGGYIRVDACAGDPSFCNAPRPIVLGETGFQPNTTFPAPTFGPGPSVKWAGGNAGWIWVDGTPRPVRVPGFCVGSPGFCP